jgi:hypothetical protein
MAKVTSKLQVTLLKAFADRFGMRPGDGIEWEAKEGATQKYWSRRELRFDRATQSEAERGPIALAKDRGLKREDFYDRGSPR